LRLRERDRVASCDPLVRRFPEYEFAIRRLCLRDPEFRAVCDDYGEVQRALEQATDRGAPERAAEYRQMLEELASEALACMNALRGA